MKTKKIRESSCAIYKQTGQHGEWQYNLKLIGLD